MTLNDWAHRHAVPPEALAELRAIMGTVTTDPHPMDGASEAAVQTQIRLEASRIGARLWRNNVGATYTKDGQFLRYGLANDSKAMNTAIKSSDLIGLRPVLIEPWHVGTTIGQFVAREVKAGGWKFRGSAREKAQLAFLELVVSLGGDAQFANKPGSMT